MPAVQPLPPCGFIQKDLILSGAIVDEAAFFISEDS